MNTLTSAEGLVFVRMGTSTVTSVPGGLKRPLGDSFLVCLEPQPEQQRFRVRWSVPAPGNAALWEATPAVEHGRAYAALTRVQGERAVVALCCLAADSGRILWEQELCSADEFKQGAQRRQQHLVTCAGGLVLYGSHAGALTAVEASTGRRAWAVRYPSRGPRLPHDRPSPRALALCLVSGNRVYVAPADHGRVLCLHLYTGQLLWESNPLETVHLLGVAEERLFLTSTTPYACVRALATETGRDLPGLLFPDEDSGLADRGRGLLVADTLLWPTNAGLLVLDRATLRPRLDFPPPRATASGNVLVTPTHLLIADQDQLTVYDR